MQGQTADLIKSLAPLFAAGFAIQQLVELFDGFFSKVMPEKKNQKGSTSGGWKKVVLKLVAFAAGSCFAIFGHMRVFGPLGYTNVNGFFDGAAAALIISGGTEGVNSIVKFLGYAKEDKKTTAAVNQAKATTEEKEAIAKMGHQ